MCAHEIPSTGSLWASRPFEALHIDTMGPFPPDSVNNKFIHVMIDSFSRYVILAQSPTNTALDAAISLINNVMCIFGVPQSIRSDNGKEYSNNVMKNLTDQLQIAHDFSIPFQHETNGLVERKNRDVLSLLRKLLIDFNRFDSWSVLLPSIQLILNTSICSITRQTPHSIIFGTDLSPRRDLLTALRFSTTNSPSLPQTLKKEDAEQYINELTRRISDKIDIVNQRQQALIKKMPTQTPHSFKVNDLVLRTVPKRTSKLHGHEGPFKINSINNSRINITHLASNLSYDCTAQQLIPFHSDYALDLLEHIAASDF
ncbi:hypothetical protein RCL1_002688 [Eukaryota sp. TZLM3-RCL]